jgi:hypothetical protein
VTAPDLSAEDRALQTAVETLGRRLTEPYRALVDVFEDGNGWAATLYREFHRPGPALPEGVGLTPGGALASLASAVRAELVQRRAADLAAIEAIHATMVSR